MSLSLTQSLSLRRRLWCVAHPARTTPRSYGAACALHTPSPVQQAWYSAWRCRRSKNPPRRARGQCSQPVAYLPCQTRSRSRLLPGPPLLTRGRSRSKSPLVDRTRRRDLRQHSRIRDCTRQREKKRSDLAPPAWTHIQVRRYASARQIHKDAVSVAR